MASDLNNCGGCNRVCSTTAVNATGLSCSLGSCDYTACATNFQDCDSNRTNGCESNRLSDSAHCGNCATVCPTGQSCQNGACMLGCTPSGTRQPFTAISNVTTTSTGCTTYVGNPCTSGSTIFSPGNTRVFSAYGQGLTCGAATSACISRVGINTYDLSANCQGGWDVLCDGTSVGTINTIGRGCTGNTMTNSCSITFSPRTCTTIRFVASNVGPTPGGCCVSGAGSPDSAISAVSAW